MNTWYYLLFQNYLREQPENFNNVNLVAEVAHFLLHFYSDVNEGNIELVNRIMQTLVELCVVSCMHCRQKPARHVYDSVYVYVHVCCLFKCALCFTVCYLLNSSS